MNDTTAIDLASAARYRVTGMDCPACAAKIERAVHSVGLDDVRVSIATQIMTLRAADPKSELPRVERAVAEIGYQLDRITNRSKAHSRPVRSEGRKAMPTGCRSFGLRVGSRNSTVKTNRSREQPPIR